MLNLTLASFYKMGKSLAVKISLILIIIAAGFYFYCAKSIATGAMDASAAGNINGLTDAMMMWLFGPLFAGIIICDDFDTKVIHSAISCGKGRISVVISKACVFAVSVFALILPYMIISLVLYTKNVDFTGAEATAVSVYMYNLVSGVRTSFGKVFIVSLITAVSYIGQLSICIPLAFKIRKPVVLTAIGFMIGMLYAFITTIIEKVDILNHIFKFTPYANTVVNVNLKSSAGDLGKAVLVSIIFFCFMTGIAYQLFRKEEIK